jgi:hypothetical protein
MLGLKKDGIPGMSGLSLWSHLLQLTLRSAETFFLPERVSMSWPWVEGSGRVGFNCLPLGGGVKLRPGLELGFPGVPSLVHS